MIKRYMLASLFLLPSHGAAEGIDNVSFVDKLEGCIIISEYITTFSVSWKTTMEIIGETPQPSDISAIVSSLTLRNDPTFHIRSMLEEEIPHPEIVERLDTLAETVAKYEEAIKDMAEEVLAERISYISKSQFIASCATGAWDILD